ncbi:hypothetical protein OEZ86_014624 [Tetradesmus obliquus]|nr:hypothetical protein OEZ86_014624 [Tetradesmus obliquus]
MPPATAAAAVYSPSSVLQTPQQQQQQQQQPLPGLPLHEQQPHLRSQVLLLLTVFDVLAAWGVVLRHDAALAAALQVLRYCWDTEDAWQSGLLVSVLRSALDRMRPLSIVSI